MIWGYPYVWKHPFIYLQQRKQFDTKKTKNLGSNLFQIFHPLPLSESFTFFAPAQKLMLGRRDDSLFPSGFAYQQASAVPLLVSWRYIPSHSIPSTSQPLAASPSKSKVFSLHSMWRLAFTPPGRWENSQHDPLSCQQKQSYSISKGIRIGFCWHVRWMSSLNHSECTNVGRSASKFSFLGSGVCKEYPP